MNNEETILDEQYAQESISSKQASNETKARKNTGEKWAYAAGGAVAGAGATLAGQAMAAGTPSAEEPASDVAVEPETPAAETAAAETAAPVPASPTPEAPAPEDAIIVTDDGVRVAHVSDGQSFGEAFAEARSQVGAGGVFEWHGKVYGTYYKDEWDAMTPSQRADYQASIDYEDVMHNGAEAQHFAAHAHHAASHDTVTVQHEHHVYHHVDGLQAYAEHAAAAGEPEVEVSIIGAGETDLDGDGVPEYSVAVDCNGHEILIVDIDQDGIAEAAIADVNGDGQITSDEVMDITSEQMQMPEHDGSHMAADGASMADDIYSMA